MKFFYVILFATIVAFTFTGCKKPANPTPPTTSCIVPGTLEYQWQNAYILEQTYSGTTTNITGQNIIAYAGYFQLNKDATYNVLSNGVSDNGNWDIEQKGCLLELDKGTSNDRAFSIITVNSDSLIITRTDTVNHVIYTQHYSKTASGSSACATPASLQYQWQNAYILEQFYTGTPANILTNSTITYPGYFQLNSNSTYNVLSNGVADSGSWDIETTGCLLELDKGTSNDRAFSIITVNADSLIIKRTDSVNMIIYTQHYSK